ncbi:MAG: UDP-N-acetylglucosamine 2-epimerase [Anaerolineales bacterium]|jgi:UDP-N-acetylglucosamine 2-epimerase
MIHIFIGTKAQLIKMAPIMRELDSRGIRYNYIDSGQHSDLTKGILSEFELRTPNVVLTEAASSISTITEAVKWTIQMLWLALVKPYYLKTLIFRGMDGTCLIHGDTLTTLLSLIFAKRANLEVWHIEAGFRSHHLLAPFPEEIIKLIVMKFADKLIAPTKATMDNLIALGYESKSISIPGNTTIDALRYASNHINPGCRPVGSYVVATVHRVETIYNQPRQKYLAALLNQIAADRVVIFPMHEATRIRFEQTGVINRIAENPNIKISPLMPYLKFINLLKGADFIVTDGGSTQEESHYLGIPCLVVRLRTHVQDGLEEGAMLARFKDGALERFLLRNPRRMKSRYLSGPSPSAMIVDYLLASQ